MADEQTWIISDSNIDGVVFNDPAYSFDGGIALSHGTDCELSGEILSKKEAAMLRALAKLLIDQDLYNMLMDKFDMDADAALAASFRWIGG